MTYWPFPDASKCNKSFEGKGVSCMCLWGFLVDWFWVLLLLEKGRKKWESGVQGHLHHLLSGRTVTTIKKKKKNKIKT